MGKRARPPGLRLDGALTPYRRRLLVVFHPVMLPEIAPAPRDHLVRALRADLVGPYLLDEEPGAPAETLELSPSHHYLTGFLAPEEEREPDDEGSDDTMGAGPDETEEETQGQEPEDKRKNLWPASLGLSVLLPNAAREVKVTVRFAEYTLEIEKQPGRGRGKRTWKRKPRQTIPTDVPLDAAVLQNGVRLKDTVGLVLYGQLKPVPPGRGLPEGAQALALFLVNRRGAGTPGRRDEQFLFQVEMEVEHTGGIVPRPNVADEESDQWDQKVADLQFRDRVEYAVGHGVAVEVPPGQRPVTRVRTTWLPEYEVRRVVPHKEKGITVSMEELSRLQTADDVHRHLDRLPAAYAEWIAQRAAVDVGSDRRAETRDLILQRADTARKRIAEGIALLAEDAEARRAFCLANEAMALAALKRSPARYNAESRPGWFLFQLAFLLLNLRGLHDGEHPDRERVELIFFPTGGGKTEAYLGVIAFCLLLRRLRRARLPDGGLGVTVLLRYTLRLLTLDQLGRAATLICALESKRRKTPAELGDARFSVGLWVGRSATANTMEDASKAVTTPRSDPCSRCTARRSSGALMAAVPSLPTTIPAARLARPTALGSDSPAAREAAKVEITVSPAPVTSNTSRARAGRCNGACSGRSSVMPCSPRVINSAPSASSFINAAPLRTSSASSAQRPTMVSNSWRLGVIRLAPR